MNTVVMSLIHHYNILKIRNSNLILNRYICTSFYRQKWLSVVGLEVHAQINTSSKLFSGSSTDFSSPVNCNVSTFDAAIPGTLPVLNKKCVELGILTSLALNCHINAVSLFDRKHYFYGDIPSGYQITQQRIPLAVNGYLNFQVFTPGVHKVPYQKKVRVKQIQLEQDSGKSLHDTSKSLVDLNRAGVPLMEIVFEPDLVDGEEAAALIKELVSILLRIRSCTCKLEEGALRVDANVSIHQSGNFGIRTEIKNIGSVRGVATAIRYEIARQIKIRDSGGVIRNETRAYDSINKATVAMRDKEEKQDYRYMPEPSLPPLYLTINSSFGGHVNVDKLRETIPELPEDTRMRLRKTFGLNLEQSIILVNENFLLNIFQDIMLKKNIDSKLLANILINEFTTIINKKNIEAQDINFNYIADIVEMLQHGTISRNTAKMLLFELVNGNEKSPLQIVTESNLTQITDSLELETIINEVLLENSHLVNQFRSGKTKTFKALLGIVANKTKHRADMAKSSIILKKLLT